MKFYSIKREDYNLNEIGVVIGATFYWCMNRYEGDDGESHFDIEDSSFCWGYLESDFVTDCIYEVAEIPPSHITSAQMACIMYAMTQ